MSAGSTARLAARARRIDTLLERTYGRKEVEGGEDPLDTLIETILSQNTTDANSHKSFMALKTRYSRWEDMERESPKTVAGIIKSGGLADIKAKRILDALRFIRAETGSLDLGFLRGMTPSEVDRWLGQIKGVGPKTRSIVILFALNKPAFPVDTHIHRVSRRMGLIGQKTSREKAQEELGRLVPPEEFYNFHMNLIEHGRAVCQARKPRCEACPISRFCWHHRDAVRAQAHT